MKKPTGHQKSQDQPTDQNPDAVPLAPDRNRWLLATDPDLLKECEFRHFRAGGPGGQHQNKVATAVRLAHRPTGITVTATESRYQAENRRRALKKLRKQLALQIRAQAVVRPKDFSLNSANPAYPLLVATLMDGLERHGFQLRAAAAELGLSTAKLVKVLARDGELWEAVNAGRNHHGLTRLRSP